MKEKQRDLVPFFDQIIPEDGAKETAIPGLRIFRISEPVERKPMSYEPQIIIMAQGRKVIFLDNESYLYDPMNYVVLSVPLPLECVVETPDDEPVLESAFWWTRYLWERSFWKMTVFVKKA